MYPKYLDLLGFFDMMVKKMALKAVTIMSLVQDPIAAYSLDA